MTHKRHLFSGLVFSFFLLLLNLGTNIVQANQFDRPVGLDDRGPLEKVTFIHYRKGFAKPNGVGGGKGKSCYDFIARGAKWKTTEDFTVNTSNTSGLSENFVSQAMSDSVAQWETYGGNIFGQLSVNNAASFDFNSTDGQNVFTFGAYSDANVIGVTNVWGYFSGPIQTRELVEWDMLLNNAYLWGEASVNPSLMDLQNIVTHELGHSAGLDDLYDTTCNLETMYGYAQEGETEKRSLNAGDIAGIQELY